MLPAKRSRSSETKARNAAIASSSHLLTLSDRQSENYQRTNRRVIHISKGIAKNVIPAKGKVTNVAPNQTHRPDIRPKDVVRVSATLTEQAANRISAYIELFHPKCPRLGQSS